MKGSLRASSNNVITAPILGSLLWREFGNHHVSDLCIFEQAIGTAADITWYTGAVGRLSETKRNLDFNLSPNDCSFQKKSLLFPNHTSCHSTRCHFWSMVPRIQAHTTRRHIAKRDVVHSAIVHDSSCLLQISIIPTHNNLKLHSSLSQVYQYYGCTVTCLVTTYYLRLKRYQVMPHTSLSSVVLTCSEPGQDQSPITMTRQNRSDERNTQGQSMNLP